jgi:eukaryotic-like serine/threonine-protein kinase
MRDALQRISKHLLIFTLIFIVLLVVVTIALKSYTQHDSIISVPDVTTLTVEDAAPFIVKKGLRYKIVDSIRVETAFPGVILEQKPAPGAHVKKNRIIFLIVNARSEEKIVFPDVRDFSQRQAVATLEANGIRVGSIEFMPSEYRDLVLGVRYQGKNIPAGFRLPKNSSVTLVVGQGASVGEITVPSLHGQYMQEAVETAHAASLNIGNVIYDVTPVNADAAKKYQIYRQVPITGSTASVGRNIDIWMTTDENILQEPDEVQMEADTVGLKG